MKNQTIYPSEATSKVNFVTSEEIKQSAFAMIRAAASGGRSFIECWWFKSEKLKQALNELTSLGYVCSTDNEEINGNIKVRIEW